MNLNSFFKPTKQTPILFLKALLEGKKIEINGMLYYLGGDLLDLCVASREDKNQNFGRILSPSLKQFLALARTMTANEVKAMLEH